MLRVDDLLPPAVAARVSRPMPQNAHSRQRTMR